MEKILFEKVTLNCDFKKKGRGKRVMTQGSGFRKKGRCAVVHSEDQLGLSRNRRSALQLALKELKDGLVTHHG